MNSFAETAPDIRVRGVEIDNERLTVELMDGRSITVPIAWYPRLLSATAKQRQRWEIAGGGFGIHWPDVDEDLSTEGLLRGAPAPRGSIGAEEPAALIQRGSRPKPRRNRREGGGAKRT